MNKNVFGTVKFILKSIKYTKFLKSFLINTQIMRNFCRINTRII